jgi:hypothetical protein
MTTPNTPNAASTATDGDGTSVAPTSGATTPVAPPSAPAAVFGATDNVPEWLKGKTKEQLAAQYGQMYQAVVGQVGSTSPTPGSPGGLPYNPAPAVAPYAQPVPQPQIAPGVAPPAPPSLPDSEAWSVAPDQAFDVAFGAKAQGLRDELNPTLTAIHQANAQSARFLAQQADPDAFTRYGPEIDVLLSQIPLENRTVDIVRKAVSMVRSDHIDDLVAERAAAEAERLVEQRMAAGTLPSNAGVTGGSPIGSESLDLSDASVPVKYRQAWAADNIDHEVIDRFLIKKYPGMPLPAARMKYAAAVKAVKGD